MILFSHKCGQLGNRLFTFAHLIANAAEHHLKLSNLSFDEYSPYFEKTSQDIFCRYPVARSTFKSGKLRSFLLLVNRGILKSLWRVTFFNSPVHGVVIADLPEYQFGENKFFELSSPSFQAIARHKPFVFLFGRFFRDYDNFQKHQNLLRDYFKPTPQIQQNVNQLIHRARQTADLIIGVHIRLGDYAEFAGGKYLFRPADYYSRMKALRETVPEKKITFIICSNENVDLNNFAGLTVMPSSGHIVEDMYTLAGCDFIMGPPSTYSAWASFYGNKPLYRLETLDRPVTIDDFTIHPVHVHY